jgi:hypothetical protein
MLSKYRYIKHFLELKVEFNNHWIRRYVDYLELCEESNIELDNYEYFEQHHILPKADDMFPQFKNLVDNPWNAIYLTTKQHIFAHIILSKAFPTTRSTIATVHYMLNVQNSDTIWFNNRDIPNFMQAIYAANAREKFYESRKGYGPWKNPDTGIFEFLHRDDPKIQELGLVWIQAGTKHSVYTKHKMSYAKLKYRTIKLYFLNIIVKVKLFSEEYDEYIAQGWVTKRTQIDWEYIKEQQYLKSSESLSGRSDYMYPDGTYYGRLYLDDPVIQEYGLVYYMTENKLKSMIENQQAAVAFNTGTRWYNNGTINKKFKEDPGEPWVLGAINITDAAKQARAIGCILSRKDKKCYNDGKNNFYFYPDEQIPDGLVLGMAPQKKRTISDKNSKYEYWNDGAKNYKVYEGNTPSSQWTRGMVKQIKKREYCFTNGIDYVIVNSQKYLPGWNKCKRPKHI